MKWLALIPPFFAFTACATALAQPPETGPGETAINQAGGKPRGYKLAWADEFNTGAMPDAANWSYDTYRNKEGWFAGEKEYYAAGRSENSRVEDGDLIIEARHERLSDMADYGGQDYSSARLVSKKTFTFGFVEVRALLPCGKGVWPAIWTLPVAPNNVWPRDGEIDLMEYVGWNADKIYQTVQTGKYYYVVHKEKQVITRIKGACGAWHRYQMTWTPDVVRLGIDDQDYVSFKNDGSGDYAEWPFIHPQNLILNVAVGGDFGGQQGIDETAMPWRMQVDYVRLYQK